MIGNFFYSWFPIIIQVLLDFIKCYGFFSDFQSLFKLKEFRFTWKWLEMICYGFLVTSNQVGWVFIGQIFKMIGNSHSWVLVNHFRYHVIRLASQIVSRAFSNHTTIAYSEIRLISAKWQTLVIELKSFIFNLAIVCLHSALLFQLSNSFHNA